MLPSAVRQAAAQASSSSSRAPLTWTTPPVRLGRRFASAQGQAQPPHIPIIRSLGQLRRWRRAAREQGLEVGIVPTMGALHQGHLDLVKTSLSKHPLTVMTLFVNPMQFAPHEDLASYPRTLERDIDLLRTLLPVPSASRSSSLLRGLGVSENESFRPAPRASGPGPANMINGLGVSEHDRSSTSTQVCSSRPPAEDPVGNLVIFAPGPEVMYPLKGDLQDLTKKRGVEVDVKGWGDVMEGSSRRVATVCTKLFNAVEPDHAYFGQKDIQQALLLKIKNLHILPTTRDPVSHLALSSRNAYLTRPELAVAPILHRALSAVRDIYRSARSGTETTGETMISAATQVILDEQQRLLGETSNVALRMDYVEVFNRETFEPVRGPVQAGRELVVAGAVWVGKTRLIDNLLLGWGVEHVEASDPISSKV